MELSKELRIILPAIIVLTLILLGGYYIYSKITTTSETLLSASPAPSGFPTANSSPPQQKAISTQTSPAPIAQTQPETGLNSEDIKNIGIQLSSPQNNSKVASPVRVLGKANVFEGNVQIMIKDSNGKVLGSGSTTACMDVDACPFEAVIAFSKPQTPSGTIAVFSPSPRDGSNDYLQTVNVRFQ